MNFINKNRKILTYGISSLLISLLLVPVITHASFVNCDGTKDNPCNFDNLIATINSIINWIISIAGVIFTISCIYGGFLYMTSGENPGNKAKAKSVITTTLVGFVIILVSWLIVYTILNTLVDPGQQSSVMKFIGGGN